MARKDGARVGQKEKRNGRLVGAAETSKELAEWRRPQRKNVNKLSLPKKERVVFMPQREQLASTPEPPLPKRKGTEPSAQITKS